MSETTVGREPIELVEIVLPRCINTYGVAPCTATGSGDEKCYNCRATCQDVNNYRDTPDRHLTPSLVLEQGETIASGDITRTADLFAAFEVRLATVPDGIIWEQGGSADRAAYLGVTSGNLVFRAGSGTVASGANVGKISTSVTPYIGKTLVLYVEIDFVASSTSTVRLWAFDPVELTLTLIGTDTFTASTDWAGTDGGAIGVVGGSNVATGESAASWNGDVHVAYFYDSTAAPSNMSDNFRQRLFLGRGQKGEPTSEQYILPCLEDLGTIGTRINVNAAEDNYDPLGRRATLDFTCKDFAHSDFTQDPYLSDRTFDPLQRSTFWRKWLRRQKFGKTGALVRVYDGYAGQTLSQYRTRAYVLDHVQQNEDGVSFHCRDVLSRTEFRKAQVPAPSAGVLRLDIDNQPTTTSFEIGGDVTHEYPASGTVRINDEIMTYTSRAAAGAPVVTTFSGVTRATDGSVIQDHSAGDLVQVCRRYTAASLGAVLTELLTEDALIEAQLIDLAKIEDEVASYLDAYTITTLLTEPQAVSEIVGKLSEECSFYIWWNERSQKIDMQAIRAVGVNEVATLWTYEENIVANSFNLTERPKQRLNVITFYYNPIDFTEELNKPGAFKNGLKLINGTTSLPEQYGNVVQTREIFSIFLTTEAQANQTSARLAVRYADVPQFAEFYVDAKDRSIWTGDFVRLSVPMIVDAQGNRIVRRWMVVEAEEIDPGHLVRYVCADITLDGLIYLITSNGLTTYNAADFEAGNAFITDNFGLNPDGTDGARIS